MLILLGLLLHVLAKFFSKTQKTLQNIRNKILGGIIWNGLIDLLFGAQIELQLCGLKQMRNMTWNYNGDKYSVILAFAIAILYFIIPFATAGLLWKHSKKDTIDSDAFQ